MIREQCVPYMPTLSGGGGIQVNRGETMREHWELGLKPWIKASWKDFL